jgi:hypothetical protein
MPHALATASRPIPRALVVAVVVVVGGGWTRPASSPQLQCEHQQTYIGRQRQRSHDADDVADRLELFAVQAVAAHLGEELLVAYSDAISSATPSPTALHVTYLGAV